MNDAHLTNNIHYWLGQLSMADEMIEGLSRMKSAYARQQLAAAKRERAEVVKQINRIAGSSIYVGRNQL